MDTQDTKQTAREQSFGRVLEAVRLHRAGQNWPAVQSLAGIGSERVHGIRLAIEQLPNGSDEEIAALADHLAREYSRTRRAARAKDKPTRDRSPVVPDAPPEVQRAENLAYHRGRLAGNGWLT